jgi:hypothetical protein
MKWAEHAACMEETRNEYRIFVTAQEKTVYQEDLDIGKVKR